MFGSKGPVEVLELETTCEPIPDDMRILRNMLDSVKDDSLGCHSWLGIKKPKNNKIVLTTTHQDIYRIVLVNYQKNKDRGVKSVDIFVDNQVVFQGELDQELEVFFNGKDESKSPMVTDPSQIVLINERRLV